MKIKIGEYVIEKDKIHYIRYYGQSESSYFVDKTACVVISFDFQNIEFKGHEDGFYDAYKLFVEWSLEPSETTQEKGIIGIWKRLTKQ